LTLAAPARQEIVRPQAQARADLATPPAGGAEAAGGAEVARASEEALSPRVRLVRSEGRGVSD